MDYKEALRAKKDEAIAEQTGKFYEMAPKSSDVWGPVSTAPSQTVTGAKQPLGESGKTFSGSGGYEYGQLPDGAFVILKSGRGAAPGTVVKPGMKGYDAIKSEFEMVKAGKPVSSKPASPKTRSAAAPKSTPAAQAAPPAPQKTGASADRLGSMYREAAASKKYSGPTGTEGKLALISKAADAFVSVHKMPLNEATATAQAMADAGSFGALEALAARSGGGPTMRASR